MMEYFVSAEDKEVQRDYEERIQEHGLDVSGSPGDSVLVSIGGDGSILYNVSVYDSFEAILPVRHGDSAGNRCTVDETEFEEAIRALEDENYSEREERKLSAYDKQGDEIGGDFSALSEIGFHHTQPNRSALFSFDIEDPEIGFSYSQEAVQGDSIVVSTPYGSTGYFETITEGDSFEKGLGIGFNNFIEDKGTKGIVLTEKGEISFQILDKDHKSNAKLFPDIADSRTPELRDPYEPEVGEEITVKLTDEIVKFLEPEN